MKQSLKMLASALALLVAVAACEGGSGSTSTGGVYYTHDELAREFVRRVNTDTYNDISLVKSTTLQYDYIVVYDYEHGSYDAYYIGNYNVGENVANYLYRYQDSFYFDLIQVSTNTFEDPWTGTRFEKKASSSKDLAKIKAVKELAAVGGAAKQLRAEFGMSQSASVQTARLAYYLKNNPNASKSEVDSISKEIVGSSVTDLMKDVSEGNASSLKNRYDLALEKTGMGPEALNALIEEMAQDLQ